MMQQKIAERLVSIKRKTGETETDRRNRAVSHGWADCLRLIQRIAANSRYFTDSATKIVHDVAQGEAAVRDLPQGLREAVVVYPAVLKRMTVDFWAGHGRDRPCQQLQGVPVIQADGTSDTYHPGN